MRRLHLHGSQLTVGPVNKGDSDEVLATALGLEMVLEEAFCPFSSQSLRSAQKLMAEAQLVIIAPVPWGPGNLSSLDLAMECLQRKCPVAIVDPRQERDFTGGKAWQKIGELVAMGGIRINSNEELLKWLLQAQKDAGESAGKGPK